MSTYGENTRKHFLEIDTLQQNLFVEILKTEPTGEIMGYLEKEDQFKSHFIRQKTFHSRIPKLMENPRNTLELIVNSLGEEKWGELKEKGYLPRQPPISFSYFIGSLVDSLDVPKEVAVYLSTLRTTISCCDDLIDKNSYYNVFGDNLFYVSHLMLDLGELSLFNSGLLSEEKGEEISRINRKLLKLVREGEEEQELFKKSFPQGYSFAKIAGLFSSQPEEFKNKIQKASGYYDYGGHLLGEILDQLIGEPNYLDQKNKTPQETFEEAIKAYEKAIDICPDCSLRECFISEKEFFETKFHNEADFEEAFQQRKDSKEKYPTTLIVKKNLDEQNQNP